MSYIKRDNQGKIVAVSQAGESGFVESVQSDNEEIATFFNEMNVKEPSLDSTDQDFIRVLEDVVELLISKGVILFTDLPESAQDKMMRRQRLRDELSDKLNLIGSD